MAELLIDTLTGPFDPSAFRDEYRDRVLEMIDAKVEGREVKVRRYRPKAEEGSLEEVLKRSIAAGKERRVA